MHHSSKIRLFLPLLLLLQSSLSTVLKVGYSIVKDTGSVDDSPLEWKDFVQYDETCDDRCCWISYRDRCHYTGYHIVANEYTTYVLNQDDPIVIECNKRYHKYKQGSSCKGGRFEGSTIIYDVIPEKDGVIVLNTLKDCEYFGSCNACVTNDGRVLVEEKDDACHVLDGFYQVHRDFGSNPCNGDFFEPTPAPMPTPQQPDRPTIPGTDSPRTARPTPPSSPALTTPSPVVVPSSFPTISPPTTTTPLTTLPTLAPTPLPIPAVPTSSGGGLATPAPTCSISNDAEPCVAQG